MPHLLLILLRQALDETTNLYIVSSGVTVKSVRDQSFQVAKLLGVDVLPTLPLLEEGLQLRSPAETTARLLAMTAVAASAYGFDNAKAVAWLKQEGLADAVTEEEKSLVFDRQGEPEPFRLQVEGMWALAWALGIANELNFAKECDEHFVEMLLDLKRNQSSAAFRRRVRPRPLDEVFAVCDLAHCLHWVVRNSQLTWQRLPKTLKPYVAVERRRALEWLLSMAGWDEVRLDT